jgi:hypothetical protein
MAVYVEHGDILEDVAESLTWDSEDYTSLSADIDEKTIQENCIAFASNSAKNASGASARPSGLIAKTLSVKMAIQINLYGYSHKIISKNIVVKHADYSLSLTEMVQSQKIKRGTGQASIARDEVTVWRWARVFRHDVFNFFNMNREQIAKVNKLYTQFGQHTDIPVELCFPTAMYMITEPSHAKAFVLMYEAFDRFKFSGVKSSGGLSVGMRNYFVQRNVLQLNV